MVALEVNGGGGVKVARPSCPRRVRSAGWEAAAARERASGIGVDWEGATGTGMDLEGDGLAWQQSDGRAGVSCWIGQSTGHGSYSLAAPLPASSACLALLHTRSWVICFKGSC